MNEIGNLQVSNHVILPDFLIFTYISICKTHDQYGSVVMRILLTNETYSIYTRKHLRGGLCLCVQSVGTGVRSYENKAAGVFVSGFDPTSPVSLVHYFFFFAVIGAKHFWGMYKITVIN